MTTTFERLGRKLQLISTAIRMQAERTEVDLDVMKNRPQMLAELSDLAQELSIALKQESLIADNIYHRSLEDHESLMTTAIETANAATVIGPSGRNIELLVFSDPRFSKRFLTEVDPIVLRAGFKLLTNLERDRIRESLELEDETKE